MATSQVTYNSGIIGQAETDFAKSTAKGKNTLGKDDFLKLLVTQLQQQNPLNPTDDKEFVAQMAQFSSLEQLTNISSGIGTMTSSINQQGLVNAVGFIGKSVEAAGDKINKSGTTVSPVSYTLSSAASDVQLNIFDANGNIVQTVDIGPKAAGTYSYTWDGKTSNGQLVDDGNYSIAMGARTADGNAIMITPTVSGTVTGVTGSNGSYQLALADGRTVNLLDVQKINNTTTSTGS